MRQDNKTSQAWPSTRHCSRYVLPPLSPVLFPSLLRPDFEPERGSLGHWERQELSPLGPQEPILQLQPGK